MKYIKRFYNNIHNYHDTTIILADSYNPKMEVYGLVNNLKIPANIELKDGLSADSVKYYQGKQYTIYYLNGMDKSMKEMYGYSVSDYGIREININF